MRLRSYVDGVPARTTGPRTPEQAARRRGLLEPLLPDLVEGLGEADFRVTEVTLRLALDCYRLGDHAVAMPLFEGLLPSSPATPSVRWRSGNP
ncbi:hypothetical protein [Streptomyces lasiicapitis]|uniref:Tetratricopeptide repeat protein n=1 Tax=Streptomyces lasiicapitis TaxID=1923961 RepID=A0ABQ2MSS0_9ACTN|nr:hypothetical protein [Streptomyces lasiicapitis]GGO58121.1 hypothetical protein GCM10012286_76550 [Streptomyces lasiicapitis]